MGKGYNNYMCKKPFHPGSKANIKRSWMAEQKTENEKRKQEELKVQYEKEQDLYNNRALLSTESKDKLELNFMYEAPPGAKRERQKEDDEPEFKFEWQRKYNAPREDYAKGNADIKDQPFGIPVRNVRCIKCHKWGHINTDKECPLFSQASTSSMPTTSMDPMELMRQMREDGYNLKENVLGHQLNPKAANQQFIPSDESDPEMEFLKSLSASEKKKLLRKLKKLSKKHTKTSNCKKKKSKKSGKSKSKDKSESVSDHRSKKKSKQVQDSSDDSVSDSSTEASSSDDTKKKKFKRKRGTSPSSESESELEKKSKASKRSKGESSCSKTEKSEKKNNSKKADSSRRKQKHLESEDEEEKTSSKTKSAKKESKTEKKESRAKYDSNKAKEKYSDSENDSHKHYAQNVSTSKTDKSKLSSKEGKDIVSYNKSLKKIKHSEPEISYTERCEKLAKKNLHKEFPDENKEIQKNFVDVEYINTKNTKSNKDCCDSKSEQTPNKTSEKLDEKGDFKLKSDGQKNKTKTAETVTTSDTKCDSPLHPDGFSHVCPQAVIEANYLPSMNEYEGDIHDKFRHCHRERRSPSVKQKYNK